MDSPSDTSGFPYLSHVPDEDKRISRKDEVLLSSVLGWYNEDESRVTQFSDIVKHKNGLSLRIIDWLITNFSKKVSVSIETRGIPGDLYRDYHKNLSAHNKKNFDPFARRQRICILLFGEEKRFSTIGQLNFFRWFLQKNLCSFLLENKPVIEKHMRDYEKMSKKRSKKKFLQGKELNNVPGDFQGEQVSSESSKSSESSESSKSSKSAVEEDRLEDIVELEPVPRCKPQSFTGSFTLRF